MAGNRIGTLFSVTTFGESHGKSIGVVIDGCPAGVELNLGLIQEELDRRRPGQSRITTQRNEADQVEILSGLFEGKTTGSPLCAVIQNQDQRSSDYKHLENHYRPSHADFTYQEKYGHRDPNGGGRSSARETAARVIAGAIAKQILSHFKIEILAYVSQVGRIAMTDDIQNLSQNLSLSQIESNIVRCPEPSTATQMIELIESVRKEGDTIGGIVSCFIKGCPVGLGEPVFDRLQADLAKAMLSINAAKGFEYGSGFKGVELRGSEHNDPFVKSENGEKFKNPRLKKPEILASKEKIIYTGSLDPLLKQGDCAHPLVQTSKNHSGGIQGGISNGMDIYFRVAFKPVSTLLKPQQTAQIDGTPSTLTGRGRHDPCVVPRAVPIVEAMAAIILLDHLLRNQSSQIARVVV